MSLVEKNKRHDARRDVAFYPRVGILTDLTVPFPFFRGLFTGRCIPIYSLVIGFARHCVASVREISARDRSFQPSEKFMSCAGRKTRERERARENCMINKYRNASIYTRSMCHRDIA